MARIRTIKPEFWKHEALSELPEATHMLAAALLNYADDHGYFNANPKLVQAECCPLREPSVSVPESLRSLHAIRYIELGTGDDGKRYGRIVAFDEHQRVSHPTDSKISSKTIDWSSSGNIPEKIVNFQEVFCPEQGKEQGTGNGREQGRDMSAVADEPQLAFDAYNVLASELCWPIAQSLNAGRRAAVRARLRECGGIDGWRAAMGKARASPFLRGDTGRDAAHAKWVPDFDFFTQQKTFTRLMEGKFDDRASQEPKSAHDRFGAGVLDFIESVSAGRA